MASTINAKNTSTGVVITPDASGQLELQTADTTRMTITSSGKVGIGNTSPATTGTAGMTIGVNTILSDVVNGQSLFGNNVYYDGSWKYYTTGVYTAVRQQNGAVTFHSGPSASAGSTASNMDTTDVKMIINSSGNVGIGTSSPSARLNVTGTSVVANIESTNNNNVMGILFNGSVGGYIGASASTLQFSNSSGTGVAAINSTNFQFNSGYGSVATAYGCRAWVNFNGTGTVAIRASGNVTSITDNGTGNYTVNFTTAMPDANYSALANAGDGTNFDVFARLNTAGTTYSTGSLSFRTSNNAGTNIDCNIITVAVFR